MNTPDFLHIKQKSKMIKWIFTYYLVHVYCLSKLQTRAPEYVIHVITLNTKLA